MDNSATYLKCPACDHVVDITEIATVNKSLTAEISRLRAENERLQASCVAMRGAMLWFCDRVEKGEVRSVRTYARFKEILDSTTAGAAMLRVVEAARALMAQRKQMNVNGPPKDKTKALAEVGEMLSRTDALDAALTGLDGEPHAITDAQMQAVMDMDAIGEQAVADLDAGSATCTKERER